MSRWSPSGSAYPDSPVWKELFLGGMVYPPEVVTDAVAAGLRRMGITVHSKEIENAWSPLCRTPVRGVAIYLHSWDVVQGVAAGLREFLETPDDELPRLLAGHPWEALGYNRRTGSLGAMQAMVLSRACYMALSGGAQELDELREFLATCESAITQVRASHAALRKEVWEALCSEFGSGRTAK